MFKRKVYDQLLEWKEKSNGKSAMLVEGARRVGKSTVVEEFAKNEYDDYILIDFSNADKEILANFDNINHLDSFFRNLFLLLDKSLTPRKGLIIFDEVQFFPRARQSIKHLVKDGRFDYIETGSLISIYKNVKDILIPSEEESMKMYPMDFEEFLWANNNFVYADAIRESFKKKQPLGDSINNKIMKTFRTYMAVGGMPQAVEAYVNGSDYSAIDRIKQSILKLYFNDLNKFDDEENSKARSVLKSLPSALSNHNSVFRLSSIEKKARTRDYKSTFNFLDESMIVNMCYNTSCPEVTLELYSEKDKFKMFMGDTGLLISLILKTNKSNSNTLYKSLILDDLSINERTIFENMVAQMLKANNHSLYFHEFYHQSSSRKYEIDFLLINEKRVAPVEVKSSNYKSHKSFDFFKDKYKLKLPEKYIIYTKDFKYEDNIYYIPIYMTMCL